MTKRKRRGINYRMDFSIGYADAVWDIETNGNNLVQSVDYMHDSGAWDRVAYCDGWDKAMQDAQ